MRDQPVDGAVEIAAVRLNDARDIGEDGGRKFELRMQQFRRGDARLEHLEPQWLIERAHFDAEAAGEARAHALFKRFEFTRRPVGGDDDLPPRIDERVQRMAELLLDRFAAQELHVVDDEHIDRAQLLLEGDRRRGLERAGETVHEFLGGEIDHAPPLRRGGMGGRLQQMRFAETDRGVDVERIEAHGLARRGEATSCAEA